MLRKKESKEILKKREVTTALNNSFAISRNFLDDLIQGLGKDGKKARGKSSQTLREIARVFVADLQGGIEDGNILPEECVVVLMAGALTMQLMNVDPGYKAPNGDLLKDVMG